jgi:hypothetical protein
LLARHEEGEDGGQVGRVFELRERLAVAIQHRAAGIENDLSLEICFLFVLFDVQAIGPGQHPPVEKAETVATSVFAMLGELDAETLVGAGVQAADKTFDHAPRDHRQVLYAGQGRRVQVAITGVSFHRRLYFLRSSHSEVNAPTNATHSSGGQ